jgi:hypothetical protein
MTWKNNHWVKFLEGYCTGKNQIQDEYVRKVAKNLGLKESLDIKFPWQQEILEKFESKDEHRLIILTGTAGDGKTKLCRDIVKSLDGDNFDENKWNANGYFSTQERIVVKDFSELNKGDKERLIRELIKILETGVVGKSILVAVNDGILIEDLEKFIGSVSGEKEKELSENLKEIIEDKINLGFSDCDRQELVNLINLSKLNAKENMSLIFGTILNHSGWSDCEGCEGKESQSCSIYKKYSLLKSQPHIKENLSNIILLLQLNNEHFTIRELLNLTTNTLLASVPKANALKVVTAQSNVSVVSVMNCKAMSKVEHASEFNSESSIDVGFWGMNLGPHKMHSTRPYSEINKLAFGSLSTNYWDNLLKLKDKRGFSIPLDLDNNLFDERRLEGTDTNNELWGALIRRSRIQLYCYQKNDHAAFHLQNYFHFGSYREKIYNALQNSDRAMDVDTIAKIVLSLNRVFHGRYISENSGRDRLFVPEKGQGSIAPISIFHGEDIRERDIFIKSTRHDVNLSGARIEPVLILELDRETDVKISLTVELFDYLMHVSQGAPPNTTDPRLYKKLLILRAKISLKVRKNPRTETYSIHNGEFKQNILEVRDGGN